MYFSLVKFFLNLSIFSCYNISALVTFLMIKDIYTGPFPKNSMREKGNKVN